MNDLDRLQALVRRETDPEKKAALQSELDNQTRTIINIYGPQVMPHLFPSNNGKQR